MTWNFQLTWPLPFALIVARRICFPGFLGLWSLLAGTVGWLRRQWSCSAPIYRNIPNHLPPFRRSLVQHTPGLNQGLDDPRPRRRAPEELALGPHILVELDDVVERRRFKLLMNSVCSGGGAE